MRTLICTLIRTLICILMRTLVCTFRVPAVCLLAFSWSVLEQCDHLHFVYTIVYIFVCTVAVRLHSIAPSSHEQISVTWFTRQCNLQLKVFAQPAAFFHRMKLVKTAGQNAGQTIP